MKKHIITGLLCAMIGLSACNDFLELKPLDKVSGDQLTQTPGGLKALLANIYTLIPMEDFSYRPNEGFNLHNYNGVNGTTNIAMYTDEATRSDGDQGIGPEGFTYWPYGDIRQVNLFLDNIAIAKNSNSITVDEAERLTSEAHFIRAYIYFGLAKRFGGVPLIDHAQDGDYTPGDASKLFIPRSTELDTWKFVLNECDQAIAHLPETVTKDDGIFRASKWAAYGLKSRVALFAASVAKYWNNAPLTGDAVTQKLVGGMSVSDADFFYQECISASEAIITLSGKSLYKPNPTSPEEAVNNYRQLFLNFSNDEVIFGKAYLDGTIYSNQGHNYDRNYILAQVNTGGSIRFGRFNPTLNMVDLYENYTDDGTGMSAKIVTRTDGNEVIVSGINTPNALNLSVPYKKYNDLYEPFKDKDARLLASIIVPGTNYAGTKIILQGGIVKQDGNYAVYANDQAQGKDGKIYFGYGAEGATQYSGFAALGGSEDSNYSTTGFSIRKYMQEGTVPSADMGSTTSYIDMRLAEFYLNYAEAVVESGKGDVTIAARYINDLRHRAAHTDNIPLTLDNVLKERRVEMAFEGHRYWDLVRRREFHKLFNATSRTVLVPMVDLRESTPKYIFVRAYFHKDEQNNGRTFQPGSYYTDIPGIATNGLVPNP
ncbi:RagB/SusD family nutrient uptake outer membrane protein [Dysgonomonas termitidis]|uniref:RagB/SusD family nutrient uptake outer membrane protein n=1 Tax=Dysgonomonas termitidis TaxID=1516126 RepID=A0ABV9L004_9BACT